jgi:hypothetical protein
MKSPIPTLEPHEMARRAKAVVDEALRVNGGDTERAFGTLIAAIGQIASSLSPAEGDLFLFSAIEVLTITRREYAAYCRGEVPFAFLSNASKGAN